MRARLPIALSAIALFAALGGSVYAAGRIDGRSIRPGDRRRLARELALLTRNESRRFELGVSGSDRAQSRFSWDRIAEDTDTFQRATAHLLSHEHSPWRQMAW